jgi:polysaccharide biosynthesis/export protein
MVLFNTLIHFAPPLKLSGRRCLMKSGLLATLPLILLLPTSGCSTASSLGIPLTSGNHSLMSAADEARSSFRPDGTSRELEKIVLAPHRIEPGDVVSIEPVDFNSGIQLPGDQTVPADGTINIGSFGSIYVVGQTTGQIENQVETRIAARSSAAGNDYRTVGYSNPPVQSAGNNVSVRLVSQESERFYVLGEIKAPGSYPLSGNETVLDALIAAGGVTTKANEHKIILVRPAQPGQNRVVLPICYQSIVQLGDTSTNFQIYPGDRIFVPSLSLSEDIRQSLKATRTNRCPHCEIP